VVAVTNSVAGVSHLPYLEGHGSAFLAGDGKKLKELAALSGRGTADELVQDVVEGYFDELAKAQEMLASRYDSLKSNVVKPIPGDDIATYFRNRSAAARRPLPGS
jgi:hypothetical protein